MNFILSDGEGNYVGLYRVKSKDDTNGTYDTRYYYLRTDASGTHINVGTNPVSRGNAVNGYFDDLETAIDELNWPDGYGGGDIDTFATRKFITYYQQHVVDTGIENTKTRYSQVYDYGIRDYLIKVEMGLIFPTYAELVANDNSSWADIDELVDHVMGIADDTTVSFRICTDLDDAIFYGENGYYDLWTHQMQDEMNYPSRIQYGSGHVSLSYEAGLDKCKEFVGKLIARYWDRTDGRVLWAADGMTGQNEAAYNYENQPYIYEQGPGVVSTEAGSGNTNLIGAGTTFLTTFNENNPIVINGERLIVTTIGSDTEMATTASVGTFTNQPYKYSGNTKVLHPTIYDYSPPSIAAFRAFMENEYETIEELNASWGESNASFAVIQPPKSGVTTPNPQTPPELLCAVFATNKGKDWWRFNNRQLKNYLSDVRQIILDNSESKVKFVLEFGSVTDIYSPLRQSLLVNEMGGLGGYSDMLKAQLGIMNSHPDLAITVDVFRSVYGGKFGTELSDDDAATQYGAANAEQVKDKLLQMAYGAIQNGATHMMVIPNHNEYYPTMLQVITAIKQYMDTYTNPVPNPGIELEYSVGQQLENPNFLLNAWKAAGGSNTTRIKMIQSSDFGFGENTSGCAYPISIYGALHTFCLHSPAIKSFGYTDAVAAGNQAVLNNYNQNYFRFLSPTHTITYPSTGDLAKSNWRIVGNSGTVYVSNVQKAGYRRVAPDPFTGYQPKENNNHPDRRYPGVEGEDSVFYLPKSDGPYTIYMTNTGTVSLQFLIDILDPGNGQNSINLKDQIISAADGEQSYVLDVSNIPNTTIPQVKLNCNRN
ncbi:beta-galactosidase [Emticicia agri]|nr:beta-galactosidase [Emticicia agri]